MKSAVRGDAGFTLVEVLVALSLLALISLAGLAMLTGLVGTSDRTDETLQELSQTQRAIFVLTRDIDDAKSVRLDDQSLTLTRRIGSAGAPVKFSYSQAQSRLERRIVQADAEPQGLLSGIKSLQWRALDAEGAWRTIWPEDAGQPRAIAISITFQPKGGAAPVVLERVVRCISPP